MSSDYNFTQWKFILGQLETLVTVDQEFQTQKIHDKTLSDASNRLSGVLGEYIHWYNQTLDCLRTSLQIQKRKYMEEVVRSVAARILELKHQLSKLNGSHYQFLGQGLVVHRLTADDAEFSDIPQKIIRPEYLNVVIKDIFDTVDEKRELLAKTNEEIEEEEEKVEVEHVLWWQDDSTKKSYVSLDLEPKEEVSEESLKRRGMINLIKAHEKSRVVILNTLQRNLKRKRWAKQLEGSAGPEASKKVRERAASFIIRACRQYFELKRQKMITCKREELLDMRACRVPTADVMANKIAVEEEIARATEQKYKQYEEERKAYFEEKKKEYLNAKGFLLADDFRNFIRQWFRKWFDEVIYFQDIPNEKEGRLSAVMMEEVPTPSEWQEAYAAYMEAKKKPKDKSRLWNSKKDQELIEKVLRREQRMKEKSEQQLLKKMMKNPDSHPGYHYPSSNKITELVQAIDNYHKIWDWYDKEETREVKKGFVKEMDEQIACMEVKLEVLNKVEDDMKQELKVLKKALKADYERNKQQMPEKMKNPKAKKKKAKKIVKAKISENIVEKLEELAIKNILKDYPRTKFEEFLGEPNFAGEDIRAQYKSATPFEAETRSLWWERCCEVSRGGGVLLVAPPGFGKSMLVHVMASVNDAVLFEVDLNDYKGKDIDNRELKRTISLIASCAKAVKPAVVYFKHVHKLFYIKVPAEEKDTNWKMLKRFFIKRLMKTIPKTECITFIGSSTDPWTSSAHILKAFPSVLLLPNTGYTTTMTILKQWLLSNRSIPKDLELSSLAHQLQGFSFGALTNTLQAYCTAERVLKMAVKGLTPKEVHDYFMDNVKESKPDYNKYLTWYQDKTPAGHREKKHAEQQTQFKQAIDLFAERKKKKKAKIVPNSAISSAVGSLFSMPVIR